MQKPSGASQRTARTEGRAADVPGSRRVWGHGIPVEIGGQVIRDGDLVVADGDGAVVVPMEVVDDVLKYAIQEAENDREARRRLFEIHGIEPNESVERQFDVAPHPKALTPAMIDRLGARVRGPR